MSPRLRMTPQVALVMEQFLRDPDDLYGLAISKETGLPTGTVYPILQRLLDAGYVTARREPANPENPGRPPRRLFSLSAAGRAWAVPAIDQLRLRLAPPLQWRPAT